MKTFAGVGCGRLALFAGLAVAVLARGADFTWLASPASGNWNETDANWSGAGTMWVNAPTNNAVFGASSAQAITTDAVTLSNLTFNADGYTVGGGPLLLNGNLTVGSGLTATLTAPITHPITNLVLYKYGTGTVVLNPGGGTASNIFASIKAAQGTVHVIGGTNVVTLINGQPESNPAFWIYGGTLVMGGGLLKSTGNMFGRVSDYGTLLITNGYVDLTSYGELLNAHNSPGNTTVAGSGTLDVTTLRISQCNWSAAANNVVNVNTGGVLKLARFGIDPGASPKGMVIFNGGTVVAKASTADFLGTWTNKWLLGITCKILEGGAVFDTGANIISIKQPLVSGAASDGGLTKRGAGILSLLSTNLYNGPTVIEGGLLTFDPQANTQKLFNVVTCADTNCTVVKGGSGALVFDPGATAVNTFGSLWCSNGTMVVASGTNYVTRYCNVQNGPGLRVSGGTLLVAGGVVMTTTGQYVNVDGGTLLVTNGLVDTSSCDQILNGIGSSCGYTTVSDSGAIWANQVRISQNGGNPSNNLINVNTGGVLRLKNFYIDINASQKGIVFLNGGTLEARANNDNFFGTTATFIGNNNDRWLTNIFACVREGGAKVDTHGYTIGIKNPLLSGAAADGGLTKIGDGRLTLYNTNTYNGATAVLGGTLRLGQANALIPAGYALVGSGAVLDLGGYAQTFAGIGGDGVVSNGALTVTVGIAPGNTNSIGTLTLAMTPASLSGTLLCDVAAGGVCDCLCVKGNLDVSNLALSIANPESLDKFKRYTVAACGGALTGAFTSAPLPSRWLLEYNSSRVQLVYNFGTLISVR